MKQEEEVKRGPAEEVFHVIQRQEPEPTVITVGVLQQQNTFVRKEYEHAEQARDQEREFSKIEHKLGRTG